MTEMSTDAVTALAEDIADVLTAVSDVSKSHHYIASPVQLDDEATRFALPAVFYHYAGIRQDGRNHDLFFDLFLFAKAESLIKIKSNSVMPLATAILQRIRKGMWCTTPKSRSGWVLTVEVPHYDLGDHLVYRQRWSTNYKISN